MSLSAAHQANAAIKKIATMDEFETVCKSTEPCVVVFNSSTCSACDSMEQAMQPVIAEYPKCTFYSVQASDEAFKTLDKKKLQIKAWPTTHFIKRGKVARNERGAMSEAEFDKFTYELVNDKPKPLPKVQSKPVAEAKEAIAVKS